MLTISRTDRRFKDRKGAEGKDLNIIIGPISWPAIERGDGYKWMRPGVYDAEFGYVTFKSGRQLKAIRFLGKYSKGRIYIHAANEPHELQGCIAPGMRQKQGGVSESTYALDQIFNALGGWVKDKRLKILVQ